MHIPINPNIYTYMHKHVSAPSFSRSSNTCTESAIADKGLFFDTFFINTCGCLLRLHHLFFVYVLVLGGTWRQEEELRRRFSIVGACPLARSWGIFGTGTTPFENSVDYCRWIFQTPSSTCQIGDHHWSSFWFSNKQHYLSTCQINFFKYH